ncbi:hypothetical protein AAG570_011864 [Ranatra chinensis]|uniref:Telomerase reverse transcriptase n=1 Tax=Ranatra chinensis TaxID=642074 RepID=A0ABD0YH85_9HEMI
MVTNLEEFQPVLNMNRYTCLRDFISTHLPLHLEDDYAFLDNIYIQTDGMLAFPGNLAIVDSRIPWVQYSKDLLARLSISANFSDGLHPVKIGCRAELLKHFNCWSYLYTLLGRHLLDFLFLRCRLIYAMDNFGACLKLDTLSFPLCSPRQVKHISSCSDVKVVVRWDRMFQRGQPFTASVEEIFATDVGQVCSVQSLRRLAARNGWLEPALCQLKMAHIRNTPYTELIKKTVVKRKDGSVTNKSLARFVECAFVKVVPKQLVGNRTSLKFLARKVGREVVRQRSCPVSALMSTLTSNTRYSLSLAESLLQAKIVLWLVEKFVFHIIHSNFYTAKSMKGQKAVFYLAKSWKNFEQKIIKRMIMTGVLELTTESADRCFKIRILRKSRGTGHRVLVYSTGLERSVSRLDPTMVLLKQLTTQSNCGVPLGKVQARLNLMWKNLVRLHPSGKLYYVKADVRDAFGSIKHDILLQILRELFRRYVKDKMELRFYKFRDRRYSRMLCQFSQLEPSLPSKIYCEDPYKRQVITAQALTERILEFVDNIYISNVRNGATKKHKMKRGIPQGAFLSPLLCELYFIDLDQKHLSDLVLPGDMFMRAVDDYLFISPSLERASEFLNRMERGFPEYGVTICAAKTLTNVRSCYGSSVVPFFGTLLDTVHRCITPNLSFYKGANLRRNQLTVNTVKNGRSLGYVVTNVRSLKLDRAYLDPAYNCKEVIFTNVFSAACVMACRYIASIPYIYGSEQSNDYLIHCMDTAASCIASKASKISVKSGMPVVKYSTGKYLAYRAFVVVLRDLGGSIDGSWAVERAGRLHASRLYRTLLGSSDKKVARHVSA